ncbi:TetR family transcriptional regulator C-terminal domain-containing protein [Streptomyces sp. NBC_01508]|uniref:TetR family transcriptional regulator C-terminal domain-containing protein n=1 Tax=Streptomyces sp. NBC_01508 TaxID=2903888 RepID=UPI00386C7710
MTVATGSPASTGASSEIQRRNEGRVETRVATGVTTGPPSVRATLLALLPVDERSRTEALVANAFLLRSLKDPEIAERFRAGHAQLRDLLASVIASARAAGEFAADLDPVREGGPAPGPRRRAGRRGTARPPHGRGGDRAHRSPVVAAGGGVSGRGVCCHGGRR